MIEKLKAHIYISGAVQGVFFRSSAKEKADEVGVFGFVRNLPDGRVEAIFEGEKDEVEEIVDWCRQGPGIAKVERLDLIWEDYTGEFDKFEIK